MLIDISKFMIISQDQFNELISLYEVNLDLNSDMYLFTYLFANFLAYFLIAIFLYLIYRIVHKLMPINRRKYLC